MADHYKSGQPVRRQVTFKVGSTPTDPGAVTAKLRRPDGTSQTYVYLTHPELTRTSAGVFLLQTVETQIGRYGERFEGTTPVAAVQEGEFYVDPSDFDGIAELSTSALTTVDRVEVFLKRVGVQGSEPDEQEDRLSLIIAINGFSNTIHRWTGREFKPQANGQTRIFAYDGGGYLTLEPYEARTVTGINVYGGETYERTLAASEWKGRPRQKTVECQTYLWLTLPIFDLPLSKPWMDVEVTGDWGAAAVPADVELACLVAIANAYQRQEEFAPRVIDQIEVDEIDPGPGGADDEKFALPRSARRFLKAYQRVKR